MRKAGCVEPVIYFTNRRDPAHPPGYVMLAPYTSYATPEGYERNGAETLAEIDKLQKTLQEQEYLRLVGELADDESRLLSARSRVRDDLYTRMTSGATSEYEKEFIRGYLQLRDEKRARYHQRYLEYTLYLHAREMDTGKRRVDEEVWTGQA